MGNIGEMEDMEMLASTISSPLVSFSSSSSSSSSTTTTTTTTTTTMPLLSLNHVSFVCKSVNTSVKFYEDVLGFVMVKRPSSFNFQGAWLFNHGIGIHLLESDKVAEKKAKINPKDNHISFQCSDIKLIVRKLEEMKIEYVTAVVEEGGIKVDQLFFHDPDGYMIEICNCQNLPVLPLSSCPLKLPTPNAKTQTPCAVEVAALMMENLVVDMMNISI